MESMATAGAVSGVDCERMDVAQGQGDGVKAMSTRAAGSVRGNQHPLQRQLAQLRRRARGLLLVHGVGAAVGLVLVAVLLLIGFDYLVQFRDPGLRWLLTATGVAAIVATIYRYLIPPLRSSLSDLVLAHKLERRFPELTHELSSAVEFLRQPEDDPLAGSAALRRAVVHRAAAKLEAVPLQTALDARPSRRAAVAAALVVFLALAIGIWQGELLRTGLVRLAKPWGDVHWPQQFHLQFLEPVRKLALGQVFEVELVDVSGRELPEQVWIEYRFADQELPERMAMQFTAGRMVARREAITRPFSYRAWGGDDDSMPWIEVELVNAPAIVSSQVTLDFPAYTGWAPQTGQLHLRALRGTHARIVAQLSKPLASAELRLEQGPTIPAELSVDGRTCTIPAIGSEFVIEQSGSYTLEFKDHDGLIGGDETRYEIRALEDFAPTVTVDQPLANLYVTSEASVPLEIHVKDDLAIQRVDLIVQRSDQPGQEQPIPLVAGPDQVPRHAPESVDSTPPEVHKTWTIKQSWDLSTLQLPPGTQLTFLAAAADYFPHTARSVARKLQVVTSSELEERIALKQATVLQELNRLLKLEQESRGQTQEAEIQQQKIGQLSQQDLDRLQSAELTQRQVDRGLTSSAEGVVSQIQGVLEDLQNNRLDSPEVERQMQRMLTEIQRLERENLPLIGRELTQALKTAQQDHAKEGSHSEDSDTSDRIGKSLSLAGQHQDQVIRSLEQLSAELAEWDNYRRFYRDIGQLRREQESVSASTAELGKATLSKDLRDLTPQQQADLEKLAQRQQDLARQLERATQQMKEIGNQLAESDPLAAETIADAVAHAESAGLGQRMRQGAEQLKQNQMGQSLQQQEAIGAQLQEMLDILANRREQELERLVRKLREAEQQMQGLRAQHDGLRKQLEAAHAIQDETARLRELERLAREEQKLQEQAERMARQLERLQAAAASQSATQAGEQMQQAGSQAEQGQGQEAAEAADLAQEQLDQAQQQLAEQREQMERDLAREQLAKLEDGLRALVGRQQGVIDETVRLEQERQQAGRLSRGAAVSLKQLAGTQAAVRDETEAMVARATAAEAFQLALRGAIRHMNRAGELLSRRQTDAETLAAEQSAQRRLEQILAALGAEEAGAPEEEAEQQNAGGEGGQDGGEGDGLPLVSQFKVLRLLQQEINRRTEELASLYDQSQSLTPSQQREFADLAVEQGELAEILEALEPRDAAPEDDPEKLPDLQQLLEGVEPFAPRAQATGNQTSGNVVP
jgi:hypothetical protein